MILKVRYWTTLFLLAGAQPGLAQTPAGFVPDDLRAYTAYRAPHGMTIDGRLDEDAWKIAPWTKAFVDIRDESHPAPTWETRAKLLWDDEYLYIAAYLEEPHVWATLTERDAIIYRDHDFEVFLDPEGDAVGYYEFEVNALGTMFDLYLNRPYNEGGTADISWDAAGLQWAVHLDGTLNDPTDEDRGWSVEIAIPWRSLVPPGSETVRLRPNDGEIWRVNFSRVQWPLRQSWDEWPVDMLFPMLYNSFYLEDLEWIGAMTSEGVTAVTHSGATLRSGLYLPDLTPGQLAEAIRVSRNAGAAGVSTFEMNGLTDEHLAVIRAAL